MPNEKIIQIAGDVYGIVALTNNGNLFTRRTGKWISLELPELHVVKPKPRANARLGYGPTKAVKLAEEEYAALIKTFGVDTVDSIIESMCQWLNKPGNQPYKDFNIAIHGWIKRDRERNGGGDSTGAGRKIDV